MLRYPINRNNNNKKYGNKKVCVDGILFDSKDEVKRYYELRFLERAGKVKDIKYHEEFELIPTQYETYERFGKKGNKLKDGVRLVERAAIYTADFTYIDCETGEKVVEDVKCEKTKTEAYVIRRKLMYKVHGIKIKEVMYGK